MLTRTKTVKAVVRRYPSIVSSNLTSPTILGSEKGEGELRPIISGKDDGYSYGNQIHSDPNGDLQPVAHGVFAAGKAAPVVGDFADHQAFDERECGDEGAAEGG